MRKRSAILVVAAACIVNLTAVASAPNLIVRDVDGDLVGTLLPQMAAAHGLSDQYPLWVSVPFRDMSLLMLVSKDAVWTSGDAVPFLYESADCSGPALLETPDGENEPIATVVFDTTVFAPKGKGSSRVIRSRGIPMEDLTQCASTLAGSQLCCSAGLAEETRTAAEAVPHTVASFRLNPPFHSESASETRSR